MIVGICVIELHIPHSHSLKEKRKILLGIKNRVKNRYNIAIAEVGEQDKWQRAVLGITTVSNDQRFVNQVLDKVIGFISSTPEIEMIHHQIELL
ncbi:MAG: DUF503 domain-containing protein [Nitrospiria bacterium]